MIHSKIIGIGVIAGLCSMAALAEPAVQPGETLESLSKVKVTTTVNGQPGSISDLVNSGKVQPVSARQQVQPLQVLLYQLMYLLLLQQMHHQHLQRAVIWLLQRHKTQILHRHQPTRTSLRTQWQKMGALPADAPMAQAQ